MKIIVFGPPCSGKTTISALIAEHLGIVHINFRDLCLAQSEIRSEIGRRWSHYMDTGKPFDENLANQIVSRTLDGCKDFVIEGYPKRKYEVDFFHASVGNPDLVLVLTAQEELLWIRSQKRRVCLECKFTFSIDFSSTCPQCGKLGEVRKEDASRILTGRLAEYRMQANEAIPALKRIALQYLPVPTDGMNPEEVLAYVKSRIDL